MSHFTEEYNGLPFTRDELKVLTNILKHPDIKKMSQQVEDAKPKEEKK